MDRMRDEGWAAAIVAVLVLLAVVAPLLASLSHAH
jgi:hypothetical protein